MPEEKLSRRGFLKGAAIGAGTLAMTGINLDEARAAKKPKKWTAQSDVIIVGLGVAGATAAIAAADAGAKVLILERGAGPSGATPVSSGTIWLPMNPLQQQPDSVENVIKYLKNCAKDQANDDLIRTFAENSKETAEWLLNKIGLKATQPNRFDYHPDYPGAGRGRNISTQGAGAGLMKVLVSAAKARKVEIRTGVRIKRLIVDDEGRVIGVMGEKPEQAYKAKRAVILCAGGFSANEYMKKNFLKVYPAYGQVPGLLGEGILMGMGAGAALEGMNEFVGVSLFPIPGQERGVTFSVLNAPSCIMVNRKGQRFCNESANYDTVCTSYYAYDTLADAYANVPAWVIFDEQVLKKGPISPSAGWSKDNSEEIKKGWIKRADSLADLANQIRVEGEGLTKTIETYNGYAVQGKDPQFHRGEIPGTLGMAKLAGPPFYAIQAYPGLYDTAGGLKINPKGQVLNPFGEAIKRLYAAGTTSHMAIGFYYPNGGTAIGQPLVFGRIAGRTAAAEKPM